MVLLLESLYSSFYMLTIFFLGEYWVSRIYFHKTWGSMGWGAHKVFWLWFHFKHEDRIHVSFMSFTTKHTNKWMAQPEMPSKYLRENILGETLMTALLSFPRYTGPYCLWEVAPTWSWTCACGRYHGTVGTWSPWSLSILHYRPFWVLCAVPAFQSSSFLRKGTLFLLTSM